MTVKQQTRARRLGNGCDDRGHLAAKVREKPLVLKVDRRLVRLGIVLDVRKDRHIEIVDTGRGIVAHERRELLGDLPR